MVLSVKIDAAYESDLNGESNDLNHPGTNDLIKSLMKMFTSSKNVNNLAQCCLNPK